MGKFDLRPTRVQADSVAPVVVDGSDPDAEGRLRGLVEEHRPKFIVDTFDEQLAELLGSRHPERRRAPAFAEEQAGFVESFHPDPERPWLSGVWAYFPWNDHLVHYLPEDLHTELRTARNRDLVTAAEQDRLYRSSVAVAGLSLGNSVALTLTVAGMARELRLADYDTISGSNLNRIRRGFGVLPAKKTAVTAQEILEINPYAELDLFPEGLSGENLEEFVLSPQPVDVIVDEVDNQYLKIELRRLARRHRLPIVGAIDLQDTVFVDVERFDLHPDTPIYHGCIPEEQLDAIGPGSTLADFVRMSTKWVGTEGFDIRLQRCLAMMLQQKLAGWPQLAETAFTAGAAVAYAVKKILLGEPVREGGVFIAYDQLFDPSYFDPTIVEERRRHTEEFLCLLES